MYALTYTEDHYLRYEGCREDHDHSWCDQDSYGVTVSVGGLHKDRRDFDRTGYLEVRQDAYDIVYAVEDVPVGGIAHVVIVTYTDGDTFGSNGYWTVGGVYASAEAAEACAARCRGANDSERAHRPWDGYFAGLDDVRVEAMTVRF